MAEPLPGLPSLLSPLRSHVRGKMQFGAEDGRRCCRSAPKRHGALRMACRPPACRAGAAPSVDISSLHARPCGQQLRDNERHALAALKAAPLQPAGGRRPPAAAQKPCRRCARSAATAPPPPPLPAPQNGGGPSGRGAEAHAKSCHRIAGALTHSNTPKTTQASAIGEQRPTQHGVQARTCTRRRLASSSPASFFRCRPQSRA